MLVSNWKVVFCLKWAIRIITVQSILEVRQSHANSVPSFHLCNLFHWPQFVFWETLRCPWWCRARAHALGLPPHRSLTRCTAWGILTLCHCSNAPDRQPHFCYQQGPAQGAVWLDYFRNPDEVTKKMKMEMSEGGRNPLLLHPINGGVAFLLTEILRMTNRQWIRMGSSWQKWGSRRTVLSRPYSRVGRIALLRITILIAVCVLLSNHNKYREKFFYLFLS